MQYFALLSRQQRYFFGAIIVLLLVIFFLTTFLVSKSLIQQTKVFSGTPLVGPHSVLQLYLSNSTIHVTIDTHGDKTSGIQFILQYDPSVLTNVQLIPSYPNGFIHNARILAQYVDSTNGKINFAELLPVGSIPISGKGTVATITFRLTDKSKTQATNIKFIPGSTVVLGTKSGVSVLKRAQNLTIPKQ